MVIKASSSWINLYAILKSYKVLNFTKIRSRKSLLYMLKILIKTLYFLPLVLLTCISIIYSLIYLNLINIRMLRRLKGTGLPLKTLLLVTQGNLPITTTRVGYSDR